jgi:mRNA interferase HicA
MKRKILIRQLTGAGCFLKRHGQKHYIYENTLNGRKAPFQDITKSKRPFAFSSKNNLGLVNYQKFFQTVTAKSHPYQLSG